MYAIVANGKACIVHSIQQLENIKAIYPFPKFQYCKTEEQALIFLRQHERKHNERDIVNYGWTANSGGYLTIEYFIDGINIYYNLKTENIGKIIVRPGDGYVSTTRGDLIKVKVLNTSLNDLLIKHHIIAIQRILRILGDIIDVNIVVPDMSVYLALTAYKGKDSYIRTARQQLEMRPGAVAFTVKDS